MKFKEVYSMLINSSLTSEEFATSSSEFLTKKLGVNVEIMEQKGSPFESLKSEMDGIQEQEEEIYVVLKIDDCYVKFTGTCDSYGRNEWGGLPVEVVPEQYTATRYISINNNNTEPEQLTINSIWEKLKLAGVTRADLGLENVSWQKYDFGQVDTISSWGGEGEGSSIGVVYHFKDHNLYMRIDGNYQSHYGSDWDDDPYEVRPEQKTITVYE